MELGNPMSRKKRETWGTRPYSFLALGGTTEVVPFPSLAVARRGIPCLAKNARHGAPGLILFWRLVARLKSCPSRALLSRAGESHVSQKTRDMGHPALFFFGAWWHD